MYFKIALTVFIGLTLNAGFFSRNRKVNPDSSFSVLG